VTENVSEVVVDFVLECSAVLDVEIDVVVEFERESYCVADRIP
jgi:hypothetical protein